jgi:hypothetical protein
MSLFSRKNTLTLTLPIVALLSVGSTCGTFDCDDPDCATNDACTAAEYVWVAVRSRTATQADIDTNTPGPDIDAIELFDGAESFFIDINEIYNVQGAAGTAGNNNAEPLSIAGIPDGGIGGDCDLAEDPNGKFWSMGSGELSLGAEGFVVAKFEGVASFGAGAEITVYEIGAGGCDNVGTARDDEYEIYIGTSAAVIDTVDEFDTAAYMSLGLTGAGGDTHTVTVP